jgi:hypothetical protein
METIDYTIEKDNENCLIKLQGDSWKLNICLKKGELHLLENIKNTNWENRNTIKAGTSANASVFWVYDDNKTVSILVGDDPETWDFAVTLSITIIEKLFDELLIG